MKIDWANDDGPRARVIDLTTGEQLVFCAMADEETGEFEQWAYCPETKRYLFRGDEKNQLYKIPGKSQIRIDLLIDGEPYLSPDHPPRYANA